MYYILLERTSKMQKLIPYLELLIALNYAETWNPEFSTYEDEYTKYSKIIIKHLIINPIEFVDMVKERFPNTMNGIIPCLVDAYILSTNNKNKNFIKQQLELLGEELTKPMLDYRSKILNIQNDNNDNN